jgi:hypothetical protein
LRPLLAEIARDHGCTLDVDNGHAWTELARPSLWSQWLPTVFAAAVSSRVAQHDPA